MAKPTKPPGIRRALNLFEGFHAFEATDVRRLPRSVRIPKRVFLLGPCKYITYRSDKWRDGSHDYIHEIDSYPRVLIGLAAPGAGRARRLPRRITGDATLVQVRTRALGFGYTNEDGEDVDSKVRKCAWYWHPQGKALLLIQEERILVAVVWGGELGFEDRGIVG